MFFQVIVTSGCHSVEFVLQSCVYTKAFLQPKIEYLLPRHILELLNLIALRHPFRESIEFSRLGE